VTLAQVHLGRFSRDTSYSTTQHCKIFPARANNRSQLPTTSDGTNRHDKSGRRHDGHLAISTRRSNISQTHLGHLVFISTPSRTIAAPRGRLALTGIRTNHSQIAQTDLCSEVDLCSGDFGVATTHDQPLLGRNGQHRSVTASMTGFFFSDCSTSANGHSHHGDQAISTHI
jgi:hypothetical protein